MLTDVTFLSLGKARQLKPRTDTLLISILDRSERAQHKIPSLQNWRSVLCLNFEDASEESACAEPGQWPDEPDEVQHALLTAGRGEHVPTLADASQIIEFAIKHNNSIEELHLVVHCRAGVSRSAAVAEWVNTRLQVRRLDELGTSTEYANKRLLRLMDRAYANVELSSRGRLVLSTDTPFANKTSPSTSPSEAERICRLLAGYRFSFQSESALQAGIAAALDRHFISFKKEHRLDERSRPDFLIGTIAVEVKTQGTISEFLRQAHRYLTHESVSALIVIGTPKWMPLVPSELIGKPIFTVRLLSSLL